MKKGRPATLLKKRLWHRCFPVNFVKFLRTPFLQNTSGRLLVEMKLKDIPLTIPGDRGIPAITYPAPCYCHVVGLVLIYLTQYFLF